MARVTPKPNQHVAARDERRMATLVAKTTAFTHLDAVVPGGEEAVASGAASTACCTAVDEVDCRPEPDDDEGFSCRGYAAKVVPVHCRISAVE